MYLFLLVRMRDIRDNHAFAVGNGDLASTMVSQNDVVIRVVKLHGTISLFIRL